MKLALRTRRSSRDVARAWRLAVVFAAPAFACTLNQDLGSDAADDAGAETDDATTPSRPPSQVPRWDAGDESDVSTSGIDAEPSDASAETDVASDAGPLRAIAVTVGGESTCAITERHGVKCWGSNNSGKLGNGTFRDSPVPVDVIDLVASQVSMEWYSTCAITARGGRLKCWGGVYVGDASMSDVPVDVPGITERVSAVAVADYHTCVAMDRGGVKCWGSNDKGQLGNGTTSYTGVGTPVDVVGLTSRVVALDVGSEHTCALTEEGAVKCWGSTYQTGLDANWYSTVPVDVPGLASGVTGIRAGYSKTCALTTAGGVKCWGYAGSYKAYPSDVVGFSSGVAAISSDCAVMQNGSIKCGFYFADSGQTPHDIVGLSSKAVAIAGDDNRASLDHACAVLDTGGVMCWGENNSGQLGTGAAGRSDQPLPVIGFP